MIPRRRFLAGLGALLCAPAIVRVSAIMPVKAMPQPDYQWITVARGFLYTEEAISDAAFKRAMMPGLGPLQLSHSFQL